MTKIERETRNMSQEGGQDTDLAVETAKRLAVEAVQPEAEPKTLDVAGLPAQDGRAAPGGKLSLESRVEIALSGKPSREQAATSGVHHSRVCDIRKDAEKILKEAWQQRRPGRRPKEGPSEEVQALLKKQEEMTRQMELLQMRNDWLELEKKMIHDRIKDAASVKKKRRKKSGK